MHRMLHSISFYVSVVFLVLMAGGQLLGGMSTDLNSLLGVSTGGEADFMASAMGAGVIYILIGIVLSVFVCGDYSNGYAKNIFTVHASPKDYIGGKLLSMGVTGGFFLALYTVLCLVALPLFGYSLTLTGGLLGLITFLLEKWFVLVALCAAVLLIAVFTRNTAWSIFGAFVIATGGLTMGAGMFLSMFGLEALAPLFDYTISGTARICTMTFDPMIFIRVLATCAVWVVLLFAVSHKVLQKKDI